MKKTFSDRAVTEFCCLTPSQARWSNQGEETQVVQSQLIPEQLPHCSLTLYVILCLVSSWHKTTLKDLKAESGIPAADESRKAVLRPASGLASQVLNKQWQVLKTQGQALTLDEVLKKQARYWRCKVRRHCCWTMPGTEQSKPGIEDARPGTEDARPDTEDARSDDEIRPGTEDARSDSEEVRSGTEDAKPGRYWRR